MHQLYCSSPRGKQQIPLKPLHIFIQIHAIFNPKKLFSLFFCPCTCKMSAPLLLAFSKTLFFSFFLYKNFPFLICILFIVAVLDILMHLPSVNSMLGKLDYFCLYFASHRESSSAQLSSRCKNNFYQSHERT